MTSAEDIQGNLVLASEVYSNAPIHVMLVTDLLFTSAWCLYELAVRRLAGRETLPVTSKRQQFELKSNGNFFEGMVATVPSDLEMIRKKIIEAFQSRFNLDLKPVFLVAGGKLILAA